MPVLQSIRSLTGNSIPVYAWQSGAASEITYQFGPESLGGGGDMRKKIDELDTKDEKTRAEEIVKVSVLPSTCLMGFNFVVALGADRRQACAFSRTSNNV